MREGVHWQRRRCQRRQHALGAHRAFVRGGLVHGRWPLEPTAGLGGPRHQGGPADAGLERLKAVRTLAREAVRHERLARPAALVTDAPPPRHGQRRCGVPRHLIGPVARGTSLSVVLSTPRRGPAEPCIHPRSALTRGLGGTHAHLSLVHLAQRPTILPCHAHGVLALCDQARLSAPHHPIGAYA